MKDESGTATDMGSGGGDKRKNTDKGSGQGNDKCKTDKGSGQGNDKRKNSGKSRKHHRR